MPTETRLVHALAEAREQTDALFQLVRPDSLYERPIPERHRIVFYLGHLEAFDWNLIARRELDRPAFNTSFDKLFAFGIDPPKGRLPEDQPADWPSLPEVERYNARIRAEIDSLAEAVPEQMLHVAIEHRLMHAETFAYMLHQLPYDRKVSQNHWGGPLGTGRAQAGQRTRRPAQEAGPGGPAQTRGSAPQTIEIPVGRARLGMNVDAGFGWDNEFQAHEVDVPAFRISKYKVTNGEYLDFVRAGADPPFFWAERGGQWFCHGMFSQVPLPLDAPVYVTQREAAAYAAWRGMRLPTEPEFHRAAGLSAPSRNLDFRAWDPAPVTADDDVQGADKPAPAQMLGNGWEWTSTVFAPFPGFRPFPFYENYSAPFFDGDHYVLKGASPRTAARFLRPSFRNWFRGSYPYAYTTFRIVEP